MMKTAGARAMKRIASCAGTLLLLFTFSATAEVAEHRISMTMKDADLADVMDMISREQRINVFVSTDSSETVSFSLYDMALPDAIHAIANAAGFAVEHYDGNYYIIEREEAGKYAPAALTRVRSFELQYISVEEMQALLEKRMDEI